MVKGRGLLVGGGSSVLGVDKDSAFAVDEICLDSRQVVVRSEFIVVDDVFQHVAPDLEGGYRGAA